MGETPNTSKISNAAGAMSRILHMLDTNEERNAALLKVLVMVHHNYADVESANALARALAEMTHGNAHR